MHKSPSDPTVIIPFAIKKNHVPANQSLARCFEIHSFVPKYFTKNGRIIFSCFYGNKKKYRIIIKNLGFTTIIASRFFKRIMLNKYFMKINKKI